MAELSGTNITVFATGAPNAVPITQDRELIEDFIVENREHLRAIEANVLRLERDGADADAIHAVFREFHTIKALAGFLEFKAMEQVAHEVETMLDRARTGRITISPAIIDIIFQGADYLEQWTDALEISLGSGLTPLAPEHTALTARIRAITQTDGLTEGNPELALLAEAVSHGEAGATPAKLSRYRACEAGSARVDVSRLDYLVNLGSELLIAQSNLQRDPDFASMNPRLIRHLSLISQITDEIHRTAKGMRMMPVGRLFERMARVVRDLARRTGKEVELNICGENTELDRNLLEHLADPLMHMLRNAIDHGIEPPDDRVALGKPRTGRVNLSAAYESEYVIIHVSDDGRGLDRERILCKAVAEGLIEAGQILSDAEIDSLIFQPGFSTARQISSVSGRGVGMDVVQSQIEKLHGRIEIQSTEGLGATFYLRLRRAP